MRSSDVPGSGLLLPLQVATWTKWLALVTGATALLIGALAGLVRGRDLNLRAGPGSGDQAAGSPGSWRAGRATAPEASWAPPADGTPRTGVSLSGGGIRSASFSLGALQAVAASGLTGVRYVTSVSGGGYMAAAWAALTRPQPAIAPRTRPFKPRSPEERWVRHHTDYLISSSGVVIGSFVTLLGGLLLNFLIVLLALEVVAHPLGWVIGSAHEEMRARTPIVEVAEQPVLEVESVRRVAARVVSADCATCVPVRRNGPAYEVRLVAKGGGRPRAMVASATSASRPVGASTRLPLRVEPGLIAEGGDGLIVARQPLVVIDANGLTGARAAAAERTEVARQATIAVDALPTPSLAATGPLAAAVVERLVSIDDQPTLHQHTGTLGRDGLHVDGWMGLVLLALTLAMLLVFGVEPHLRHERPTKHHYSQALAKLVVLAVLVLVAVPYAARHLPQGVARLPGYDPTSSGWSALVAAGVGAVTLVLRLRGTFAKLPALKRFRGRGQVLDLVLGIGIVLLLLAVFLALVDLSAANTAGGHLAGLHERWLWDMADGQRWLLCLALLALILLAPVSAHAWSLYSVYASGLATAYMLRPEPEDGPPGDTSRYRIARMRGDERRRWAWADPVAVLAAPQLDGLSGPPGDELTASVDQIDEWVVCTTANIRGAGEAAPGRAAGSFTFSKSWVGGPEVGWMRTSAYLAQLASGRRRDVSVPSTVTISGAAFSPAMGKDSKGWQGRLFALANLRLGVWVANPMVVARRDATGRQGGWRTPNAAWYLRELVGWFDRTAPYVYLTDGGHWENLGLVELLRRGCTDIWMISAAGDGSHSFETMAQAMALAREELGVEFDGLELEPLRAPKDPVEGERRMLRDDQAVPTAPAAFVSGAFRYPDRDNPGQSIRGTIHVVEAALVGDLPWDVHAYGEANDDFPDIATGYQLMHHRDFEAYRMLGYTQAARALHDAGLWRDATDPVLAPLTPPDPPAPADLVVRLVE